MEFPLLTRANLMTNNNNNNKLALRIKMIDLICVKSLFSNDYFSYNHNTLCQDVGNHSSSVHLH